jgi:hypothetical protein
MPITNGAPWLEKIKSSGRKAIAIGRRTGSLPAPNGPAAAPPPSGACLPRPNSTGSIPHGVTQLLKGPLCRIVSPDNGRG